MRNQWGQSWALSMAPVLLEQLLDNYWYQSFILIIVDWSDRVAFQLEFSIYNDVSHDTVQQHSFIQTGRSRVQRNNHT
jgi:hypothetical protein